MVYFKKYLAREYIPSTSLAIFTILIDLIFVLFYYYFAYFESSIKKEYKKIIFLSLHLGTSFLILILFLTQKTRNKAVISYMRHQYKIAIISRDIGENGLKKGQPVEIVKESGNGYIVKDSSNVDFFIEKSDIDSFLDVVK